MPTFKPLAWICLIFFALCPTASLFSQSEGEVREKKEEQDETSASLHEKPVQFSADQIDFFENRIRPLLVKHCLECHGGDAAKLRGGLRLTSRVEILEGGDSGPAAVAGKPEGSLLISSVHYEDYEMPPAGQLDEQAIVDLTRWVRMGLPDPRQSSGVKVAKAPSVEEGRSFWAFQKLELKSPPPVEGQWAEGDIDRFVLSKLSKLGLRPNPDADDESLVRRIFLTLTGLPPTPEDIDNFSQSQLRGTERIARLVDSLLASPQFGERWGRHWLDVARFAESSGGGRSLMFPNAWRYRDYVIDSVNKDKPFDQFVREQIAGDLLPHEDFGQKIEQLIATGFLALGPTNYEQQDKVLLNMEVVDEQIDTVGRAFLGMTLGCARCHDHKFDPIPTADYYALAGIFQSTTTLVDGNVSRFVEQPVASESVLESDKQYRKKVSRLTEALKAAKAEAARLGDVPRAKRSNKSRRIESFPGIVIDDEAAEKRGKWTRSNFVGTFVGRGYIHDGDTAKGKRSVVFRPKLESGGRYEVRLSYSAEGNRASNVNVIIEHQDGRAKRTVNQSIAPPIEGLFVSLGTYRFEADNVASVTISNHGADGHVIVDAVQFLPEGSSEKRHREESALKQPAEPTEKLSPKLRELREKITRLDQELRQLKSVQRPAVPMAMSVKDAAQTGDGRIRIRGEVRNLGREVPRGFLTVVSLDGIEAHPELAPGRSGRLELANWIANPENPLTARVYVNRVWRHLLGAGLVGSTDNFGAMGLRPTHPELLDYLAVWFMENGWSTKKLIRKIMLSKVWRQSTAVHPEGETLDVDNRYLWRANRRRVDAEVLRDAMLFVSGQLDDTRGGLTIRKITQYDLNYDFKTKRRSIYVPAFRNSMLELFEVFDFANPNLVTGDRTTSTLPTQALFLMNDPWVMDQARAAARRLMKHSPKLDDKIVWAYRSFLGRHPTLAEKTRAQAFLDSCQDSEDGWARFCHALFASLDFRYMN